MKAIEISDFSKKFGTSYAVSNMNLSIDVGDIFGFIGPNGAGKSTTIRSLLNFIFPSSGSLKMMGKDCVSQTLEIKKITGYVPSEIRYYNNVKVVDILNYTSRFYPQADKAKMKNLCEVFEVDMNKKMKELSLGNKKKVAIVQALLFNPQLVILDEPTNGLDPLMQDRLLKTLAEENKNGATIFFSSHNLSEVQHFCKKVAVIKSGKIIDVKDINSISSNKLRIRISSPNNLADIKTMKGVEYFEANQQGYIIEYTGNPDRMIKKLAEFNIESIEIVKPGIEQEFTKYYN